MIIAGTVVAVALGIMLIANMLINQVGFGASPGVRFTAPVISASVANGTDLQVLGTDRDGVDRYLYAVIGSGTNLQRWHLSCQAWGNRELQGMPISNAADHPSPFILPMLEFVPKNTTITASVTQDSAGAETETLNLLFIDAPLPGAMMQWVGENHCFYASGTATNGSFPARANPTDDQVILEELADERWLPLVGANMGAGIPMAQWAHALDKGGPIQTFGVNDTTQGGPTWQPIPPIQVLQGGDTLRFLAQDQSAAAAQGWLWCGRVTGGKQAKIHDWFWTA